jgi:hypothetical protein
MRARLLRGRLAWSAAWAALVLCAACESSTAEEAQRALRQVHLPELSAVVEQDVARHLAGVREAADRLAPGFAVEDPGEREAQMRRALRYVQQPPKGIGTFVVSPMSFLAAVDEDGVVIARDADPDRMKGMDMGKAFPVVREALEAGRVGHGLGEFGGDGEGESSWSILFAAPVHREGERLGAVVAGIPLWRLSQRLSRQMRLENVGAIEKGLVLWAYALHGGRLFHKGVPPELTAQLPDPSDLARLVADHPEGHTGHIRLHGRSYAFGVAPLPKVGEGVGLVVIRGDP